MVRSEEAEGETKAQPALVEATPFQSAVPANAVETLCLVSVRGPEVQSGNRRPLHLSCVLDRSGSMAGKKLDTLKATLRFMVGALNNNDRLALVSYNSCASLDMPLSELSEEGKSEAIASINKLVATGSTNLNEGLQFGLKALCDADVDKRCVNAAVLLFTDGFTNAGVRDHKEMVQAMHDTVATLNDYGTVSVYTFGFQKHDTVLLFTLANEQHGCYYNIQDTDAIPTAFADCLGGLMSIVAQNAKLSLKTLGGVTLRYIHTRFPVDPDCLRRAPKDDEDMKDSDLGSSWGNSDGSNNCGAGETQATVDLGDLILQEQRDILVTLSLPASRPAFALCCELSFINTSDGKTQSHMCQLPLVTGEEGKVNLQVESHRLRLLTAEGLDLTAREGKEEATARIKSMVEIIEASPAKELPMCGSLLADLQQCLESLSLGGGSLSWKAGDMARGYRGANEAQQDMISQAQHSVGGGRGGGSNNFSKSVVVVGGGNGGGNSVLATNVREGQLVVVESKVCRVVAARVKKAGKHGGGTKVSLNLEDTNTHHRFSTSIGVTEHLPLASGASSSGAPSSSSSNVVTKSSTAACSSLPETDFEAGNVRVGQMIVDREETMRVTSINRSKAGKHGHAKCLFYLKNPITAATASAIYPTSAKLSLVKECKEESYRPHNGNPSVVFRYELEVLEVDSDGWLSVVDGTGNILVRSVRLGHDALGKEVRERVAAGKYVGISIFQTHRGESISLIDASTPPTTIHPNPSTTTTSSSSANTASTASNAASAAAHTPANTNTTSTNNTYIASTSPATTPPATTTVMTSAGTACTASLLDATSSPAGAPGGPNFR